MQTVYTIDFTNSTAQNVQLPIGTYAVTANNLKGYAGTTISTFTVTPNTTQINLQVTADGVLNVIVKDNQNNPVTAGTLQFSNAVGNVPYGSTVNIGSTGNATFRNVPYDAVNGIDLYVSQPTSDASHNPITVPQAVDMVGATQNETILNDTKAITVTLNVADANYPGITPINGSLTAELRAAQ